MSWRRWPVGWARNFPCHARLRTLPRAGPWRPGSRTGENSPRCRRPAAGCRSDAIFAVAAPGLKGWAGLALKTRNLPLIVLFLGLRLAAQGATAPSPSEVKLTRLADRVHVEIGG